MSELKIVDFILFLFLFSFYFSFYLFSILNLELEINITLQKALVLTTCSLLLQQSFIDNQKYETIREFNQKPSTFL